jgi:hypothetical protein
LISIEVDGELRNFQGGRCLKKFDDPWYEVTMSRFSVNIVAVEKQYYILRLCFCILPLDIWQEKHRGRTIFSVGCLALNILPHYIVNCKFFGTHTLEIKYVLIFSATFA